jgi:hypothetical protein
MIVYILKQVQRPLECINNLQAVCTMCDIMFRFVFLCVCFAETLSYCNKEEYEASES